MSNKPCKVDGCSNVIGEHGAKGMCPNHYWRWKTYGDPLTPPKRKINYCKVEGCHKRCHGQGYCDNHYRLFVRWGEPEPKQDKSGLPKKFPSEHKAWEGMKSRCYNRNIPNYNDYGGRGIKVCDRWLGVYGFRNFLNDMGAKPDGKTMGGRSIWSLDRIDVNGDYMPENCRWATIYEQSRNRRNNRLVPCIKYLKDKNKKYCLDFRAENKIFNKCYYTLEEAIAVRDELTEKYLDKWYR